MTRCVCCGLEDSDLRAGICFDCATAGEQRALRRTVRQHLTTALRNTIRGRWLYVRFDLTWAWERLTRTGDYKPGGYADREVPDWRRR